MSPSLSSQHRHRLMRRALFRPGHSTTLDHACLQVTVREPSRKGTAGRDIESVGAYFSIVDDNTILLTRQGDGNATRLGTLDTGVYGRWMFVETRRVLWVGLPSGGLVRIALVE
jgi:hypothetical protein